MSIEFDWFAWTRRNSPHPAGRGKTGAAWNHVAAAAGSLTSPLATRRGVLKGVEMALVIKRRVNESFWVGNTKITIFGTGAQVKLGITAERNVVILRDEVKQAIERDRLQPGSSAKRATG